MTCFRKQNCLKVLLLLSFMQLFQFAKTQDTSIISRAIEKYKAELGKDFAIVITKNNKAIYKRGVGDIDVTTLVPIASCSKWLTTAMVMTFVEQGKLSLDAMVADYLPIFKTYGKPYITIRQCLSHQTGIEQKPIQAFGFINGKKSLEEEVNEYASKKEIDYNPGEYFFYGRIGINIAARVCEIISKRSYEQLMRERIFKPLKMNTTSVNENYNQGPNPSGSIQSNATEYSNFLMMLLNKGIFADKQVLKDSTIQQMFSLQMDIAKIKYTPDVAKGYGYGLGCWLQKMDANNKATVVSSPGLFGSWPLIDLCNGYTMVIFTKRFLTNSKKEVYAKLKSTVDEALESKCE